MDEFRKGLMKGLREARPRNHRPLSKKEKSQLKRLLKREEYSEGIY